MHLAPASATHVGARLEEEESDGTNVPEAGARDPDHPRPSGPGAALDGRTLFVEKKCNTCHAIEKLGIAKRVNPKTGKRKKGPDLSDVATRHGDRAWYQKWLRKQIKKPSVYDEHKRVKHKKRFKGSDEELEALIDFLLTLE